MVRHMRVCVCVCVSGCDCISDAASYMQQHLALINQLINLVEYMQQACCMYEA